MKISAHILTIPDRVHLLPKLVWDLGLTANVHTDVKGRGPWWNAKRAWESGLDDNDASHVLVLHDDAVLCSSFVENLEAVLRVHPDKILSLFTTEEPPEGAPMFITFNTKCWGAGVVMPVELVEDFLQWSQDEVKKSWKADDTRIALFAACRGLRVYCPSPSLVQHNPDVRSSVQDRENSDMQAPLFVGGVGVLDWKDETGHFTSDVENFLVSRSIWMKGGQQ